MERNSSVLAPLTQTQSCATSVRGLNSAQPNVVRHRGCPRLSERPVGFQSSANSARRQRNANSCGQSPPNFVQGTNGAIQISANSVISQINANLPNAWANVRRRADVYGDENQCPNTSVRSHVRRRADRCAIGSSCPPPAPRGEVTSYWDCGDPSYLCMKCGAMVWYHERTVKADRPVPPKFSLCCVDGKVVLPMLNHAPEPLYGLLDGSAGRRSKLYKENIKLINAMFAFTSTGGCISNELNDGRGPCAFRLNGHNHHRIGSLVPTHEDGRPRFAQLYIYDTNNEVSNRMSALRNCIPADADEAALRGLVTELLHMLDVHNVLVQSFRMAREHFNESSVQPVTLRWIGARSHAERQYNLPTASEVAALIPGDGNPKNSRDILIETRSTGIVQRISELHPIFMSLQYRLLFPYGEDGYHVNIPLCNLTESTQRKKVTLRQYYCYRLHLRNSEGHTLHKSGRLFQTYVVDGYSAVLEYELSWYKNHQNTIRSDLYNGLQDRFCAGETDCAAIRRRVILPSSFTGGPRYMLQQYQDAMVVCRWAGSSDLFITMTCNPKWPEIARHIQETTPGMSATDRPDVVARVFKIKLDEIMTDIHKRHIFGRARAVIYMIEFQKRGLPHCHILVFLRLEDKIRDVDGIDRYISAELPSEEDDPKAYAVVRSQMMHGPCGPANLSSPCMRNGVCTKGFPKMYCVETFIRDDGWPCYRRPKNSREVVVGAQRVALDNRYVVQYNRELLVKYGCHINVEWCNQGMLVKYLFSYINKGPDRATTVLETGQTRTPFASLINTPDEIEEYINCRYISSSEACWRLLEFEMRFRDIPVERLPFHEERCHRVYFHDCDDIEDVAQRTSAAMSKFTAWMVANERYSHARLLTYAEFPTQFTWHAREKQWAPRESGLSIVRIYYVRPTMGEKYYLRLLLNVVRGPTSFAEIRTVDNHVHDTYMDACNALGLLGNDDEWVSCIREASQWQMGNQLRDLFVTILLFCTVCDIRKLFFDCLPYLSEDVAYNQRRILQNQDIVFTDDEILHFTLLEIDRCLEGYNKRLSEFSKLPQVSVNVLRYMQNTLIAAERTYNVDEERNIFMALHNGLNAQQLDVFENVVRSVDRGNGGVFFVFGSGGTGKTYL